MSSPEIFRMDDGLRIHDIKLDIIRQWLRGIRALFLECLKEGRREALCHARVANELIAAFGGLLPRVIYNIEYRYYILVGVDGKVLLYDADSDKAAVIDIGEAVEKLLKEALGSPAPG